MMHKLTLKTYLVMSLLKKHSVKNDQKFPLCILGGNNCSPRSFNIFKRNLVPILSNKRPI